jgi:membrane-associated protease RseP (regulator of RpoE activity)
MWGVDLSLFQFDGYQTWTVFFLNADRTIYGRYGTRSEDDGSKSISMEGLKKAMEGALELHAGYPANKASLAGKTGAAPRWKTAESMPSNAGRFKMGDTSRQGCVHCHFVDESRVKSNWATRAGVADNLLWSYAMPDRLGLSLDPAERAAVAGVVAGSPADVAGFKAGDRIAAMEGQPIISIADVQWVLQNAKEPGAVKAEVHRGGTQETLTLALAKGWRRSGDFAWRDPTFGIRPGIWLEPVSDGERASLGLAAGAPALRVKGVHPEWGKVAAKGFDARRAGLDKGTVLIGVDGKTETLVTESAFLAHVWQNTKPGGAIRLTVLQGGQKKDVVLPMP